MRDTKALLGHLSVALLLASTAGLARATAQTPQGQAAPAQYETRMSATFTVLIQGARVGVESVTLARTGGGWLITGSGELYPPFDLVTRRFELTYGPDWQPQRLAIEGSYTGDLLALSTSFGLTQATSDVLQGGQRGSVTQTITPRTVVLPNNFLGAYAGLAPRLPDLQAGGSLPVYIAPEGEYRATVLRVTPRRIITPDGPVDIREYDLRIDLPADPVPVQVWIDGDGHLARVVLQANGMVAVRDDLSSVLSRVEKIRVEGDEDVFIPANGFNLAATVTTPAAPATGPAPREAPAVILVGGAGPQDRDHMAYGVPVFGQIARALSEAGYFVVRYDRRGTGQSGGRVENADIDAYAGDVTQIVRWLRDRKDVDDDRIAVLGYGEGGAVALRAARREGRIKGVGLLAVPGTTGEDVTLEQQRQMLDRTGVNAEGQQLRIALQQQIIDAVKSGKGWENIPPSVRKQADTPWFRSWLQFDPAKAIDDVNKPILILQGALDAETPPSHADLLEGYARARKRPDTFTRKVIVPGVNHLLVPASSGEVDEYALLPDLTAADTVTSAIIDWLGATIPAR